jgi:protein ImuB
MLPAPANSLRLAAEQLGPPAPPAEALFDDEEFRRAGRLSEAIGQLRALAGPQAALRVLLADPQSRIPERRAVLTPYER